MPCVVESSGAGVERVWKGAAGDSTNRRVVLFRVRTSQPFQTLTIVFLSSRL
jgi:hypothetical protein